MSRRGTTASPWRQCVDTFEAGQLQRVSFNTNHRRSLARPWWFGLLWVGASATLVYDACHETLASGRVRVARESRSGSCGAAWRFESELKCGGRGFGSAMWRVCSGRAPSPVPRARRHARRHARGRRRLAARELDCFAGELALHASEGFDKLAARALGGGRRGRWHSRRARRPVCWPSGT